MNRIAGRSDQVPPPAGPYSPSVALGPMVMSSGQAGAHPDGTLDAGVGEQTAQTLRNVLAALAAAGAAEADVVSVRVYLTDVADFAAMNQAYADFFSEPYPARTTVYVGLPPGLLVEIDALAVREPAGRP